MVGNKDKLSRKTKASKCKKFQITGETVGEVRAVSGMHQRKAEMSRQADAFIALPGLILIPKLFFFFFFLEGRGILQFPR